MLQYLHQHKVYVWTGESSLAKKANFSWSKSRKIWYTRSPFVAFALRKYADTQTTEVLGWVYENIFNSKSDGADLHIPGSKGTYAFQRKGARYLAAQLRLAPYLLNADEQGLGKTIETIIVANLTTKKKLLVICPGTLRLNWVRELQKWHIAGKYAQPIFGKSTLWNPSYTCVTSYENAHLFKDFEPDLIIIDEAHYIKNYGAQRSRFVLGDPQIKWPGLVSKAPTIFLTGTPLPNGKPDELWPILYRCAPYAIDYMKYHPFVYRFCKWEEQNYEIKVLGAKNHRELYTRLRGSGFMLRRLKKDVLPQLPDKQHKFVIFSPTKATRTVLAQEKPYDPEKIAKLGNPGEGTTLDGTRLDMGLAKLPQCLEYIINLLEGGVHKVVIFCIHLEVVAELRNGLRAYNPVGVVGPTPTKKRQINVDRFQEDPRCRVFIGNRAAEEGLTLTAAQDVVNLEPSWVPGQNNQRVDRLHRIGQEGNVLMHWLLVEGSLDLKVLTSNAYKNADSEGVLDDIC